MQNGGQMPPFFNFSIACALRATKKTKKSICGDRPRRRNFLRGSFDGLPAPAHQKKINATEPCDPKDDRGSNFVVSGVFAPLGPKESSRCTFLARQRFASEDSPSMLSVLARCSPCFRPHESRARFLAQRFSKRIRLRLYRALCIVKATFRGFPRTVSSKVQICTLIVDGVRRVMTSLLIARSLGGGFGALSCVRVSDERT
jgi:hypothetical protein